MPSVYANYIFGFQAVSSFPEKEREIVKRNLNMFLIGLQGPSIFLYYNTLGEDEINNMAQKLIKENNEEFFCRMGTTAQEYGLHEDYMAYIYGCICNHVINRQWSKYVKPLIANGYTPLEIEIAFDKRLMAKNSAANTKKYALYAFNNKVDVETQTERVVSDFYDGVTPIQAKKAMEAVIIYSDIINSRNIIKRCILVLSLLVSGQYSKMKGLLSNLSDKQTFDNICNDLCTQCKHAAKQAGEVIGDFCSYLDGKKAIAEFVNI